MAARMPKLSKEAMLRIVETSQAEGLSPDAVILKFLPAPKKSWPESTGLWLDLKTPRQLPEQISI